MHVMFVVWTILIQTVDVQPAGETGTEVGFASFNCWFHELSGVHMTLYTITDCLGLIPVLICFMFGVVGLGVNGLKRTAIGGLFLPQNLDEGECILLNEQEICSIFAN